MASQKVTAPGSWRNGDRYEGEFRGGHRHGGGTYILAGGGAEICEWRDGERVHGSCAPVVPGGREDAPGRAEQPVRDPALPGEATRRRVADWIDRCNDLWERELVPRTSVRSYDLMDDQEARAYLATLYEYGGPWMQPGSTSRHACPFPDRCEIRAGT